MDGILDPPKVLTTVTKLLPHDLQSLSNPGAALAAIAHAIYIQLGFRLHPAHAVSDSLTNEEEKKMAASVLPDGWGQAGRDLSLAYKHNQSAMTYEVGTSKIGGRLIVNALAVEVVSKLASRSGLLS